MSTPEPQPTLVLSPHPEEALGVQGYLRNARGSYLMHWGDGTVEKLSAGQIRRHLYPEAGAYSVAAGYEGKGIVSRALIFVRNNLTPQLAMKAREDNPNIWQLSFNETKRQIISWYQVDWGDNSDVLEIAGPQGSSTEHGYRDGSYDVAVRDLGTMRWWRHHIDVAAPAQDPNFTWTYVESDTSGMTVEFTLTAKQEGKTVRLYWDDDGLTDDFTETGQKKQHKYTTQGSYIVQAVYTDGTGEGSAWGIDVPNPKVRVAKPVSQIVIRKDPLNPLATWTVWAGSITGYDLHFGDGTSTRRLEWQPPVRHVYPSRGKYLVWAQNDLDHRAEEWVDLGEAPPPPSDGPEIQGGKLSVWLRWPTVTQAGPWAIMWPDWPAETITPTAGEWISAPALPGKHVVTATHIASGDTTQKQVTVTDKKFSVDFDIEVNGRKVRIRRTAPAQPEPPQRWWLVFWGDEWDAAIWRKPESLPNDTWTEHTYTQPGRYFIEVASPAQYGTGLVYTGIKQVTIE